MLHQVMIGDVCWVMACLMYALMYAEASRVTNWRPAGLTRMLRTSAGRPPRGVCFVSCRSACRSPVYKERRGGGAASRHTGRHVHTHQVRTEFLAEEDF
jgi:hypothetical protein